MINHLIVGLLLLPLFMGTVIVLNAGQPIFGSAFWDFPAAWRS